MATVDAIVTIALIGIPILLIGAVVLAIVLGRGGKRRTAQPPVDIDPDDDEDD